LDSVNDVCFYDDFILCRTIWVACAWPMVSGCHMTERSMVFNSLDVAGLVVSSNTYR